MSDLLAIGRSGILAYQGALKTIGENVTNADTEGYARRSIVLREQSTYSSPETLNRSASAFGGVQATGVQRVWDQYKASNAWTSNSDASGASTRSQYLSTVETMLNDTDTGVGTRLTSVFTNAARLSANPADPSVRRAFLGSVSDAATALNTTANNLAKVSGTISTQATLLVGQANDALGALSKINLALRTTANGTASRAQLEDQRDSLLGALSGATAIDTNFAADGSVTVRMNNSNGPVLLANTAVLPSDIKLAIKPDGQLETFVHTDGQDIFQKPTGGALAGLMDGATTVSDQQDRLDKIATDLATLLNDFQTNGLTDATVAASIPPSVPPTVPVINPPMLAGTDAASLKLVLTDPTQLATTLNGASNGNLLELAKARGPDGVEQQWKAIVTDQSILVSSAKLQEGAATARKNTDYSALDETTGVDLDNEAAELLRFQQAYSASAKIIQAARETLQDILNLF
jgi:flagellar hook-associated protein 1 FlgK